MLIWKFQKDKRRVKIHKETADLIQQSILGKGLLKSCMHIFLEKVRLHYDKFFNHGLNDDLREAKTSTKYL